MILDWSTHAARLLKTVALGCAIYSVGGFILVYLAAEEG